MPPRKRRSYTAEYKVEAAHRVIDSGRTITEVARELGIDAGMLSVWVKDERRRIAAAEVHGDKPLEAAERAELSRLRRQVAELEKGNAFLVKGVPRTREAAWSRSGSRSWCCADDEGVVALRSRLSGGRLQTTSCCVG
ncbi:hypothetical protein ALI22I_00910 [Saccharothrix sp. ALI-22-I]|uniref:transposase n=1 Tax=Saccharothrix sp. ALI-22-I TaxID=1933778 RepID=UPI00097C8370|nr:transposase [Saccharothrix sp. ALI-22-I]ONI92943.1 hypothetical protein ALI22I_00910 [Saccharothrix sp. ALI-22-I]